MFGVTGLRNAFVLASLHLCLSLPLSDVNCRVSGSPCFLLFHSVLFFFPSICISSLSLPISISLLSSILVSVSVLLCEAGYCILWPTDPGHQHFLLDYNYIILTSLPVSGIDFRIEIRVIVLELKP
jgi:hypothetical protein